MDSEFAAFETFQAPQMIDVDALQTIDAAKTRSFGDLDSANDDDGNETTPLNGVRSPAMNASAGV